MTNRIYDYELEASLTEIDPNSDIGWIEFLQHLESELSHEGSITIFGICSDYTTIIAALRDSDWVYSDRSDSQLHFVKDNLSAFLGFKFFDTKQSKKGYLTLTLVSKTP